MGKFKVTLTRSYFVTIDADNKDDAMELSEFFLGDCTDLSSVEEQNEFKFKITDVEMVLNEAIEVAEVE